jgi:hypothetical protein
MKFLHLPNEPVAGAAEDRRAIADARPTVLAVRTDSSLPPR